MYTTSFGFPGLRSGQEAVTSFNFLGGPDNDVNLVNEVRNLDIQQWLGAVTCSAACLFYQEPYRETFVENSELGCHLRRRAY